MSETEIEHHIRDDTVWRRPTWPLGAISGGPYRIDGISMGDRFGLFEGGGAGAGACRQRPETAEDWALRTLDLERPLNVESLKRRYKELVKLCHPDTHEGDKDAEEKLKVVIEAYKTLMRYLHA